MSNNYTHKKLRLLLTVIAVYGGCFFITTGVMKLEHHLSNLNPLHVFFKNFDFTDYYYKTTSFKNYANSLTGANKVQKIAIINSQCATKRKITRLLNILGKTDAEAIALDVIFASDTSHNLSLDSAILKKQNLVFAYDNQNYFIDSAQKVIPGTNISLGSNHLGFANISDFVSTIRFASLFQFDENNKIIAKSLAYSVAEKEVKENIQEISEICKENGGLKIRYLPGSSFVTYPIDSIFDDSEKYIAALGGKKIILVGECDVNGNPCGKAEKHFTPLNEQLGGKSFPDMEGIYIHANIVNTLLSSTYIRVADERVVLFYSIAICIFFLPIMMIIYVKRHHHFHFGMVIIYEPVVFLFQMFLAVYFISKPSPIYVSFEEPYLIFSLCPFAIYIIDFIDLQIDRQIRRISKNRFGSPSYFSMHRQNHFH